MTKVDIYTIVLTLLSLSVVKMNVRSARRPTGRGITHPLERTGPAERSSKRGGRQGFRSALTLFAAGGILANLGFIALLTQQLHQALWVYHDLMQNPRAYGREIDPVTIASLRDVRAIWASFGAFGIASTFGLLLAVTRIAS